MVEFYSQKRKVHINKNDPSFIKDDEALKVFPEAKSYVNKRKKEITAKIRNLVLLENEIKDTCLKIQNLKERELAEDLFIELKVNLPIKELEAELKRLNKMTDVVYIKDNLDKIKAKNKPISDFIEFNGAGMARCIFHEDKNASMKYYPKTNSVYCFGCNKSGDSIAVIMYLKNCKFKEALSILNN